MISRFTTVTAAAIVVFFAIGFFLSGWPRMLAFSGFWLVYLTIVGCGIAFIQLEFFGPVICHGKPGRMRVALTFDDGPDPLVTAAVLDLLKREKISAAFFCIGKKVAVHTELTERIATEGHLLGNHTYQHSWWTALMGRRALQNEVSQTQDAIRNATGIAPIYMRPPIGLTNPNYAGVLRRADLKMVGWDVRSMDTRWDQQRVVDRVTNQTTDGSIVLLHDADTSRDRIVAIVAAVITNLRSRGFDFERLDRLIKPVEN